MSNAEEIDKRVGRTKLQAMIDRGAANQRSGVLGSLNMVSQPATKIFLKTSEPHASEWISKATGEIEIERFRESRTRGQFPSGRETEQQDITREPLVMASEVAGLDPLHGYLKHGNLVVRMRFPYLELHAKVEKYVERKMTAAVVKPPAPPENVPVARAPEVVQVAPAKKPSQVYEATHHGANLERRNPASQQADRDAVRAELLATLDDELRAEN